MRIEEITKANLEKASDTELTRLRYKAARFWDNHFKNNQKETVGCFTRNGFVAKYRLLLKEMESEKRSLQHSTCDLDRQAFKQTMQAKADGIDLALFQEVPMAKNRVILDPGFADAKEINVTIQSIDGESAAQFIEDELAKILKDQFGKPIVFKYEERFEGPGIPLFDEVLRPASKIEKVEVKNDHKKVKKNIEIIPVEKEKKDEQIVCGIVYEPDTVDAQGDKATAEEIKKAAYDFMENTQTFKVMHKGKSVNVKIVENYIAPVDFTIAKRTVKKGSWMLVVKVLDKKLWQEIKGGNLTGYSMAGYARVS